MPMQFPFGPLAPDQGELTPGTMMVADGCIPLNDGYGPFPSLSVPSSATGLSAAPRGLFSYQLADGSWQIVAATATTVEKMGSDYTWSAIDTGLTGSAGDDMSFERFGTQLLYSNIVDGLRAYPVETAGAAVAIAAAKNPRVICECSNILFAGDCVDQTGARNNRFLRSSARGQYTNFTTEGANYYQIQNGGAIVDIVRLNDNAVLVLQQGALKRIDIGSYGSSLWNPPVPISDKFGSVGAKSVVPFDGAVYLLSTNGFRRYSMGGGIEEIGDGLIDQTFLAEVDQSDLSLVQGTVDPFRKLVLWRYKRSADSSTTIFERVIGYSWTRRKWFTLTLQTAYLGATAQAAVTWDAFVGTWDAATMAWDSRVLQGGQPLLGALDSSYKFGFFSGTNMAATLTTATADSPISQLISSAEPIDDSDDGTLELGVKNALNDAITWKDSGGVAKQASGYAPVRGNGRKIAFRRTITAGSTWTYAKGVDHLQAAGGGPR
jgi:hypothetical protein